MSYQIELTQASRAEIKALPAYIRAQALELFKTVAVEPYSSRAKELRGKPGIYRIWLAGRWRVAYRVDEASQIITILRVRRKEQIDYESLG